MIGMVMEPIPALAVIPIRWWVRHGDRRRGPGGDIDGRDDDGGDDIIFGSYDAKLEVTTPASMLHWVYVSGCRRQGLQGNFESLAWHKL